MALESISNVAGLVNAMQSAPAQNSLGADNPLLAQSGNLQAGIHRSLSIGEIADRVGQLGPGSVSPDVYDALMRAGAIDPDLGAGISPVPDLGAEASVDAPSVQAAPETLRVEETETEVQVLDSEGNVLTTMRPEEYAIFNKAGLTPQMVNGRVCFLRNDIDPNYTDAMGRTNSQRMAQGLAPLDSATGQPIELHHVGQKQDGPLAELTMEEHRMTPNNIILHPTRNGSEVEHGNDWNQEKASHWKARADDMGVAA